MAFGNAPKEKNRQNFESIEQSEKSEKAENSWKCQMSNFASYVKFQMLGEVRSVNLVGSQ